MAGLGLKKVAFGLVVAASAVLAPAANADVFLKVDGVQGFQGETASKAHPGEIQVLSYQFGVHNTGTAAEHGGAGAGKAAFTDLSISKQMDRSSSSFFLAAASGQHLPTVTLTLDRSTNDPTKVLRVTLSDVLVTAYQTSGSGSANEKPIESISLSFAKIKFEYFPMDMKGSSSTSAAGWDVRSNSKM